MNIEIKPPLTLGADDTVALIKAAVALSALLTEAATNAEQTLQRMLLNGKRQVLEDLAADPEGTCFALLTAALLFEAEKGGPTGSHLSFYVGRELGGDARKEKARVEKYRRFV
jgi:hypothetical protein